MYGNFEEKARIVVVEAKNEMKKLNHPYVGSEHLLLAILKSNTNVSKKLKEFKLTYNKFKAELIKIVGIGSKESEWFLYTPMLRRILENALLDSKENNNSEVTVSHLFSSLLEEGEGVAIRILLAMKIDLDKLYKEFAPKIINTSKEKNEKLVLDELGIDLTMKAKEGLTDPVIGRKEEINRLLEILVRRTKNNPILIGSPGVGKTAIVEELSRMISSKEVPYALKDKRLISLDMASTVAGTKYRGEFEDRIRKILKEVENNEDIILFIDEIHTLVGAGGAEGAIDASNIFKPALARGKIRLIGATTTKEYKKYIEPDGALARRFQKINIETPTKEVVKEILMKLKPIYEKFHSVILSNDIIDMIIKFSDEYIFDREEPDKSIDILDEVCAKASLRESSVARKYNKLNKKLIDIKQEKVALLEKDLFDEALLLRDEENKLANEVNNIELKMNKKKIDKVVTIMDVKEVINIKTGIPIYELYSDNDKVINKIKKDLRNKILGQDKALELVNNLIKKSKLGFTDKNRCHAYMFSGPSGVGKSYLAKIFASHLVGNKNIIKLDMSEFIESHSISKLIGSPPGYIGYNEASIFEDIKRKPYSVLILDEIEKANPKVINLFLQILDDSKIKLSNGETVRFDHTTIIMTSNVGFHDINIGFKDNENKKAVNKLKEVFSIPFINRLDKIIIFNKLNHEVIKKLVIKKLNIIKSKYKEKNIKLVIKNNIIEELIKKCDYEEFGARKIDKLIDEYIENKIINHLISNNDNIIIDKLDELLVS